MGTRGLLGYTRKDGTRKGCFNGANSYKEGLGNDIADFLRSLKPEDFDLMAERVEQIEVRTTVSDAINELTSQVGSGRRSSGP